MWGGGNEEVERKRKKNKKNGALASAATAKVGFPSQPSPTLWDSLGRESWSRMEKVGSDFWKHLFLCFCFFNVVHNIGITLYSTNSERWRKRMNTFKKNKRNKLGELFVHCLRQMSVFECCAFLNWFELYYASLMENLCTQNGRID